MANQRITFTEWTPDQPSIVENLSVATNVIPASVGYIPFPLAVDYSVSASENLTSVVAGRFSNTTNVFAGGATKLFKFNSATLAMDNVSKSGNYTGVSRWKFAQFGNNIIAANDRNILQSYILGSSTLFSDLAATAPIAKYVTIVRDFVVAANLNTGTNSNRVQWCDVNNETNWTSGGASQADFQDLPDGGNITGITGGEVGLVLMERAIVRMSYIGSPLYFQFDTIAKGLGCIEGNSVTKYGNTTYFLGEEGFYSCDGTSVTQIGNEKVDRFFFNNANPSDFESMSTTIDPFRKIVVWNFANTFGGRSLMIYNWQVNKWSYGTTDVNYIASAATAGLTLEGMDLYGTMDSIGTSFDSRLFSGGKLLFAGARGAKVITFTGQNSTAQIVTGDIGSEQSSVVTLARPIIDNGSATVSIASRSLLNQSINFTTPIASSSENRVSLRSSGKYHRLSIVPTGSQWKNIIAIEVNIEPQGIR